MHEYIDGTIAAKHGQKRREASRILVEPLHNGSELDGSELEKFKSGRQFAEDRFYIKTYEFFKYLHAAKIKLHRLT